jgi:hypothetical protein
LKRWTFGSLLWGARLGIAGMALLALVVGYQRLHRSDEQVELTQYVEHELPVLHAEDTALLGRLRPLSTAPGPSPEAARKLLVDDVLPRLIALRKRAASITTKTAVVRALRDDYIAWLDRLGEACRASVRAIDDPTADATRSAALLRQRFAEADQAAERWHEHVRSACVQHRLAPPTTTSALGSRAAGTP